MKLYKHIFFNSLLLLIVIGTSCKSTKQTTSATDAAVEKSSKGLTEKEQTIFAYQFIDGCKERMQGNIEKAEVLFKNCLGINPESSAVKYELASIYKYSSQFDLAIKYAKEAANADPKNEWYQLLYIECLHNKQQYMQAADVYTRLIKNFPNRAEFYEGLAAEYMYSRNYEKSFKAYDELEKKFGENDAFTFNKIKLLKQLKKNTEAEAEFKKLIKANPTEAKYYTYLAEFYQETQQNEKAMNTYQQILKVDPQNPMVHLALADYYKSQNDQENFYKELLIAFNNPEMDLDIELKILASYYDMSEQNPEFKKQAYELSEIIIKLHPNSADALALHGDLLFRDKKTKEAKQNYFEALKYDKSRYPIWSQLLYLQSLLSEYAELETSSAEAMELFPNQPISYFFNGVANLQLKNYSKAAESFNDGIEFVYDNKPLQLEFYSNLGEVYNTLNNFQKSDKAFDDALKIDPDNALILNNYAYYLSLRKDKLEKAEKYSKRSNELEPNNRSFIDTYGWILYQQGKYIDAELWLGRAVKIGAKSAISEHYGDVLFKLGKKEEALKYWLDAKEAGSGSELLEKKIKEKKLND